jgi:tetratricopeptide (TPR) repeat protein
MVAMIYYNRGGDLLAEKQFAAAAAANAKALRLDPSSATAKGNLLATINNWAIALGSRQHYVEAADLLKQGMAVDPSFQTFLLNYVHVYHQWTQQLCADGRFSEALDLLAGAAAAHPDQPYFRRAPAEVYRRWARSLFETGKPGAISQKALADPYLHNSGNRLASDIGRQSLP